MAPNKPPHIVARFVVRKDGQPIIGKVLELNGPLQPNRIYQIEQFMGELTIRDLGPSAIQDKPDKKTPGAPTWGFDFNWIFKYCPEFILTRLEYIELYVRRADG